MALFAASNSILALAQLRPREVQRGECAVSTFAVLLIPLYGGFSLTLAYF
jgi:hypothetical protein